MPDTQPLERLVQERQADRLPSVAAAVAQKGEQLWATAVGAADYDEDRAATPETQYRIGSITKTVTAAAGNDLTGGGLVLPLQLLVERPRRRWRCPSAARRRYGRLRR